MAGEISKPLKVTYIIGNGFDLSLGLHTRYRDFVPFFLKYLRKLHRYTSMAERAMARWLAEKIRNDASEFWNDAEMAFGKLLFSEFKRKGVHIDNIRRLVGFCHGQFQCAMHEWLVSEMKRFSVPADKAKEIRELFAKRLICGGLEAGIDTGSQNHYLSIAEARGVEVRIISFNYTDTVEQLLGCDLTPVDIEISNFGIRKYKIHVGFSETAFVHGKLDSVSQYRRLVFGVDNKSQIEDQQVCCDAECVARLRKSSYKSFFRDSNRKLDTATDWIRTSDVIVVFGHSLGETDLHWWLTIYECLHSKLCYLVRFNHYTEKEAKGYTGDEIVYKQGFLRKIFGKLPSDKFKDVFEDRFVKKVFVVPPARIKWPDGNLLLGDYLYLSYIGQQCVCEADPK